MIHYSYKSINVMCTKSISLYFSFFLLLFLFFHFCFFYFNFLIFSSFIQRELPPFEFKQLLDKCPSAFDPYSICYFLMLYKFSRSIKPHRKATEIRKEILIKRFQKEALNDSIITITLHPGNIVFFHSHLLKSS